MFTSLHYEFNAMSGKLQGYKYDKAKDYITWIGLKPKDYIPLIDEMFKSFRKHLT